LLGVYRKVTPQVPLVSQPLAALPSQSCVAPEQAVQTPLAQVWLVLHAAVEQLVPQLESRFVAFSQPSDAEPLQSRVPAAHDTQAPPEQICVVDAHATAVPHAPLELQVWTPLPEH